MPVKRGEQSGSRQVLISMNITLDGFLSGPERQMDWHFEQWVPEMTEIMSEQLARADTILLGRNTYELMADYWPQAVTSSRISRHDLAFADMMNRYRKVVFSQSLSAPHWQNSMVVRGKLEEEIARLKQEPGKHLMVYGSGRLVQSLMEAGLVDEYLLWLHPNTLGGGERLFNGLRSNLRLIPPGVRLFSSGVILLSYSCQKKETGRRYGAA